MSLLCAAIANGSTHLGLFDDGHPPAGALGGPGRPPRREWRVASDPDRTPDEWAALLGALMTDQRGPVTPRLEGVATCSAVPSVLHAWREMVERTFPDVPHVVVGPGVRTGLSMRVDSPREVGADRVVNAVAAAAHPLPAIVVDLGVATTFDVVDSAGVYLGGAIAPGLAISSDALARQGSQLRTVELTAPRSVVARNTVEGLQAGILFGHAALVDGMVARIRAEIGADSTAVIATGPLAPVVMDFCDSVTLHAPWLSLHGLRMLFAKNR